MMMAYTTENDKEEVWFLDSGCSNHMSGNRSCFIELDETFKKTVRLGNNTRMAVEGKGKIKLIVNGIPYIISYVFYISERKNKLLSLGQLHERGLIVLFKSNCCKIYHPERGLLFESRMTNNRMFKLMAPPSVEKRICVDCMKGKQHRDSIPNKGQWKASTRLELIHADLCGLITPTSNSNKRYFMCLIDDFSRKAWVYHLTEKS